MSSCTMSLSAVVSGPRVSVPPPFPAKAPRRPYRGCLPTAATAAEPPDKPPTVGASKGEAIRVVMVAAEATVDDNKTLEVTREKLSFWLGFIVTLLFFHVDGTVILSLVPTSMAAKELNNAYELWREKRP